MARHRADDQRRGDSGDGGGSRAKRPLPRVSPLRKVLLALSLIVAAAGLGLWAYAAAAPGPDGPGIRSEPVAPGPSIAPQGLAPLEPGSSPPATQPPESGGPAADGLAVWSPAIFRLGFGFFAGFCMAYALRAFMKVTIIVIGAAMLGLFGLQYAGLISVDWGAIEGVYTSAAGWLSTQTESFTRFVSGYLPTAASGAAGLAAGFTTRR